MDTKTAVVIVGVGQTRRRPKLDGEFEANEPVRLMVAALERAALDAGDPTLPAEADYVGTVAPLAWGYADTPSVLADLLGVGPGGRNEPKPGGNSPIELLQDAVRAIESGDARVAVLGGATALDPWTPIERKQFFASPGCAAASHGALEHAGLGVEDVDLFDLYSCFPCAVEWAADGLGLELDDPRPFSVTGGLACAGGPGNNYVTHAIAATVLKLREGDASVGYVSGLGMSGSKHAACVLSNDPARIAAAEGQASQVRPPAAELTGPEVVEAPEGPGRIETYTVAFDRENQPRVSRLIIRLDDGRRTVAHGEARPEAFARLIEHEGVGLTGRVKPGTGDEPNLFELS